MPAARNGRSVPTPDHVRGRLSPEHAPGWAVRTSTCSLCERLGANTTSGCDQTMQFVTLIPSAREAITRRIIALGGEPPIEKGCIDQQRKKGARHAESQVQCARG